MKDKCTMRLKMFVSARTASTAQIKEHASQFENAHQIVCLWMETVSVILALGRKMTSVWKNALNLVLTTDLVNVSVLTDTSKILRECVCKDKSVLHSVLEIFLGNVYVYLDILILELFVPVVQKVNFTWQKQMNVLFLVELMKFWMRISNVYARLILVN